MSRTLVAIGLDSADPHLLERWARAGYLPNIARLRREGAYCALSGPDLYLSEQAWTLVTTGCEATRTGYWSRWSFDPATYDLRDTGAYDFEDYAPFYALGPEYRCAVFDVPQAKPSEHAHGAQVLAWGARSARTPGRSDPPALLEELVRRYGRHPAFDRDHATYWNPVAVAWLERALLTGIERRVAICRDLLSREPWDLFFTVFGETHSAGHFFWHLSQPHPLGGWKRFTLGDPMRRVFQSVDRAIGAILATRPDADVVVFSPEGMEANSVDLPSTVFLTELLYRFSFGAAVGLAGGSGTTGPPPPIAMPLSLAWHRELWALRADEHPMRRRLRRYLPTEVVRWWERRSSPGPGPAHPASSGPLFHQPAMWYRPLWRTMTCFTLPSISHGYVRMNVQGRERDGIVPAADYPRLCDEISGHLRELRDARTGKPLVRRIVRTRASALDSSDRLPDADLIVFYEPGPVDVVDSPTFGRIGPVPHARTGGHANRGFAIVRSPDVRPGSTLAPGHVRDLAPTILAGLGAPIPRHMDGTPLTGATRVAGLAG